MHQHVRQSTYKLMTNTLYLSKTGKLALCLMAGGLISMASAADASSAATAAPRVDPAAYHIGAGDVLQISVWKEPDASAHEVVVRYDGRISVPLVREIEVLGLTPVELEKTLVEKLATYINKPDVTVLVKTVNSKKVYLVGGVKKEGPVSLQSPLTILRAINEAGGLTDYAKQKKIYVLRSDNGNQVRLPFDYQAVIRGQHMEQNILLMPDDTIVVPR